MIRADSHSLQLAARLHDIGVIEHGSFTLVEFQHDEWCPTLRTLSCLDCRCDVEALINGRPYSFGEFVGRSAQF
jgi:hypothetical protein